MTDIGIGKRVGLARGAGDEMELPNNGHGGGMECEEEPFKIMTSDVEKMTHEEEAKELEPVYRTCTVNSASAELPVEEVKINACKVQQRQVQQGLRQDGPEPIPSSWSVTKLFRNRLCTFKCCRKPEDDHNFEPGLEMENLYLPGVKEPIDAMDGVAGDNIPSVSYNNMPQDNRMLCLAGPVMTVDCATISVDAAIQRMNTSLGDAIRKLIVRNPPITPIMRFFNEPLLINNVTSLHIENCDVSVRELFQILENLVVLEQLYIEVQNMRKAGRTLLKEDFDISQDTKEYFRNQLLTSKSRSPRRLRVLTVCLPMIWQCNIICQSIEAFLVDGQLEEINIKSSLKEMIFHLVSTSGVNIEDETTWQDLVTLKARDLIQKSCLSLKHLSISCADVFPLEYLKMSKTLEIPMGDIFRWSFLCTCGVLNSIANLDGEMQMDSNKNTIILPELKNLSLSLPLVPIPMAREDDFRKPLNIVAEFLARNSYVHVVALHGLRPVKGMENWIRNSLVTIPKYRMSIGCSYTSTTLGSNLPTYDDELGSLGLEIVPDETRLRVTDIIDPNGLEVIPHTWRYSGLQCFHLVNQLPSLLSYDVNRIASKFSKLTKLIIEDYVLVYGTSGEENNDSGIRSLTDPDMQTIFKKLVCLEYLHLDCNMKSMTDRGLTGITDSLWSRLTQRDKMFSFWYLYNLKYVFLRGFGDQVTDKSAIYAFSEEYSMKQLKELHVFAPGFTSYGREKIRRAYEARNGFILELM